MADLDGWLTISDLAKRLDRSQTTIRNHMDALGLWDAPYALQRSRRWYVSPEGVELLTLSIYPDHVPHSVVSDEDDESSPESPEAAPADAPAAMTDDEVTDLMERLALADERLDAALKTISEQAETIKTLTRELEDAHARLSRTSDEVVRYTLLTSQMVDALARYMWVTSQVFDAGLWERILGFKDLRTALPDVDAAMSVDPVEVEAVDVDDQNG